MAGTAFRSKAIALIAGYAIVLQTLFSGLAIAARGAGADLAMSVICSAHSEAPNPAESPDFPQPLCPGGLACIMAGCDAVTALPTACPQLMAVALDVAGATFALGQHSWLPSPRPGASPQALRGPPSLA